ncbi:MAG: DUF1190 domain-containing protein [Pseudomonadota bacterium]|nr:DUF1190 domain-containing protein [Pseudomonadota bacterium]
MKRSKSVKLVAMGAGLLLVAACEEAKVDTAMFESIKQCKGLGFSEQECVANHDAAKNTHVNVAPKYTSRTDCEVDFGAKQCEIAPQRTTTGGSVFMPLMAGYMMGSMLGGGRRGQPLYRSRDDRANFRTADNRKMGSTIGRTQVAKSATRAPSVKTRTVSRGGFGARARSAGRRSFGG